MKRAITSVWNYLFNHQVSPLRNIKDVAIRHYVLQALGFMWAASFCIAIGSYTVMAASIIGHAVLISAVAITAATYTAATVRPDLFRGFSSRRHDGEHE